MKNSIIKQKKQYLINMFQRINKSFIKNEVILFMFTNYFNFHIYWLICIMNSSLSQLEEANRFKKHLEEYWGSKGITQIKIPQIGGKQLNLFKLYKSVCKKGGGQAVSHNKMWKEIVDQFGLPSTCTSASFTLKNHYQKYLLGYQQKFYFGKDDSIDLPQLVAGRTRKPGVRGIQEGQMPINYLNKYGERMVDPSSLGAQLNKYYQKCDLNQTVNYIKRTKMYPSMPEVKRLILGFQSRLKEQINFSINTLMLYSVNTEAPFLFMQYPNVIQSIYGFVKWIYPPKNISFLQILRTMMLALRNLAIDYRNLQPIQESGLSDLLKTILEARIDRQVDRNIIDIFSSLTNIGLDFTKSMQYIQQYLEKDTIEDLETGIDLLKTIVQEKEQICEDIIVQKIDFFARLLLHQQSFVRQAILEIFAYVTDKSESTRSACLKNLKFMNRVFAILSYSVGNNEKQLQLSGYILSNLSKSQRNIEQLKKFERKIAMISFNDDSLSPITTSLLCRFTQPEQYHRQILKQKQQRQN